MKIQTQVRNTGLLSSLRTATLQWLAQYSLKKIDPTAFRIYSGSATRNYSKLGLTDQQGDVQEMLKAFRSVVFACIHARAKEVANSAKFVARIQKDVDEFEMLPHDHPMSLLLTNPNPYLTPYSFWYLAVSYLDITGNSYWWVAKDRLNIPRALWPIPSQYVKIIPGDPKKGEGMIKEYTVRWDGQNETPVDAIDMVHLKHPDPMSPYYYGGSLIMRAAYEIDILSFVTQYWKEYFANDAIPAGVVVFPEAIDRDIKERFDEEWREKFQRKPGKVGYLEAGADFKTLTDTKSIGFLEEFGINKKTILGIFGVPPSKIMETEVIEARATAEAMNFTFHKETIDPFLTMIHQQLTLDLAKPLFDEKYDISHISTIPDDKKAQAELDKIRLDSGVTYINEIRQRDGLEDIQGGDEPLVSYALIPLSALVSPADGGEEPPTEEPAKGIHAKRTISKSINDLSETQKKVAWRVHDRYRMRMEIRFSRKLKTYFNEIKKEVISNIESQKLLKKDGEGQQIEASSVMFDVDNWIGKLRGILSDTALQMIRESFNRFISQYSIDGIVFSPTSDEVQSTIGQFNQKTKTVPQTLYDELFKELNEGIRLQENVDQLSKRVSRFFDNTVDYRSIRIARTVSNGAVNEGYKIAAKESKLFDKKTWLSMRDDKVRDTHVAEDGQEVGIQEKFKLVNGDELEMPGDPRAKKAESVINCRCMAVYFKSN